MFDSVSLRGIAVCPRRELPFGMQEVCTGWGRVAGDTCASYCNVVGAGQSVETCLENGQWDKPIGECTSQATCDAVIMDVGGKSTALFKEAGKESDRRPVFRGNSHSGDQPVYLYYMTRAPGSENAPGQWLLGSEVAADEDFSTSLRYLWISAPTSAMHSADIIPEKAVGRNFICAKRCSSMGASLTCPAGAVKQPGTTACAGDSCEESECCRYACSAVSVHVEGKAHINGVYTQNAALGSQVYCKNSEPVCDATNGKKLFFHSAGVGWLVHEDVNAGQMYHQFQTAVDHPAALAEETCDATTDATLPATPSAAPAAAPSASLLMAPAAAPSASLPLAPSTSLLYVPAPASAPAPALAPATAPAPAPTPTPAPAPAPTPATSGGLEDPVPLCHATTVFDPQTGKCVASYQAVLAACRQGLPGTEHLPWDCTIQEVTVC